MAALTTLLPVCGIILAGILVYHNSFSCPFIFDDEEAIVENPHVREWWPPWRALAAPPQSAVAGRPLVSFSLAVNYRLGGLNPWGYHAFNLAVHVLAGLVLFGVVRRTLRSRRLRDRYGSVSTALATVATVIWIVHPLQTESVTYVVQRAESLMGLCYLLTLYCVIRGSEKPAFGVWYVAAVVICGLGMTAKEVMVTAPLMVVLYDSVFLAGSLRMALRRRTGLFAALAATWVILAVLVATGPRTMSAGFGVEGLTSVDYAKTQFGVILYYLRLAFWPASLCLDHHWPIAETAGQILLPMGVILALLAATVIALKHRQPLGFLGAGFFGILAPTSTIIPIADVAFEHRMYLPLAAVVLLAVIVAHHLLRRLLRSRWVPEAVCKGAATLLVVGVIVVLSVRTVRRNQDYRSAQVMWSDVVQKRPGNPRAHNNLAKALHGQGHLDRAIVHYREAVELKPDYATAHNNLGAALVEKGAIAEAIGHYLHALQLDPDWAEAHYNLGLAQAAAGRFEDAAATYQWALELRPDYPEVHYCLGNALLRLGRIGGAVRHYEKALRLRPDYIEARVNLAGALQSLGEVERANAHLAEAFEIALRSGAAFRAQGDIRRAAEVHRLAVQIDPNSAEARYRLGRDLLELGRRSEAAQEFREALHIDPDHRAARAGLAATISDP